MEIQDAVLLILTSGFVAKIYFLNRMHKVYLRKFKAQDEAIVGTLQNQMMGANLIKEAAQKISFLEKALEDHISADLRKIIKEEWRGMN